MPILRLTLGQNSASFVAFPFDALQGEELSGRGCSEQPASKHDSVQPTQEDFDQGNGPIQAIRDSGYGVYEWPYRTFGTLVLTRFQDIGVNQN